MTSSPAHTPYDGTSKPFTIGLRPLELNEWLDVDHLLEQHLAEKDRLYAEIPERVLVEEPDSRDAQAEVLDLLREHLPAVHPQTHRRVGDDIEIGTSGRRVRAFGDIADPLRTASRLVQEDLIVMRKDERGWRLVAGSLCFPSSWTLTEKFGLPLHNIHDPVPEFGTDTRNASLITRMFDNLSRPVIRWNWSLQAGDALYRPFSNLERIDRATQRPSKFPGGDVGAAFIRVERQTLRKLPRTGGILFTIRICIDPISVLRSHPDRAALATSFAAQLGEMNAEQLDYKGLTADRDRLVALLVAIAA
jgi:hypothetical protein